MGITQPRFSIQLTKGGVDKFLSDGGGLDFRLNDTRWHSMDAGDVFEFVEDPGEERRFCVKILEKYQAESFSVLIDSLPSTLFQHSQKQAYLDFFAQWWSTEEEQVKGVIALEIKVLAQN